MDDDAHFWQLASGLLDGAACVQRARDSARRLDKQIAQLVRHKKMPDRPWSDFAVEQLLRRLAAMDCNNFSANVGVGEREGRVYSALVARRHYSMAHGIGRSGDVAEVQPKAAGSSVLNQLCNALALHAVQLSGVACCADCRVVPVATGMALTLCLSLFRRWRPDAKCILWSRIDQKTCVKCMTFTGLSVVVIEQQPDRFGHLSTDLQSMEQALAGKKRDVLCVLSTTSCFAPRSPDNVVEIGRLCKKYEVPHLVNNAYGLQSEVICGQIHRAACSGRVDFFVQSCDKNFMVPVGGSVIGSFRRDTMKALSSLYPGRASASPSIDLLITLLSMGKSGYSSLIQDRQDKCYPTLRNCLAEWAANHGEVLISADSNPISIAVSLRTLDALAQTPSDVTALGSMLFSRSISGARVVVKGSKNCVDGLELEGWGSHSSTQCCSYLAVAAAIGMTLDDVQRFMKIFNGVYDKLVKRLRQAGGGD